MAGPLIPGKHAAQVFYDLSLQGIRPDVPHMDNGPEFIRRTMDVWAYLNDVQSEFRRPGRTAPKSSQLDHFPGLRRPRCLRGHLPYVMADREIVSGKALSENRPLAAPREVVARDGHPMHEFGSGYLSIQVCIAIQPASLWIRLQSGNERVRENPGPK